MYRRMYCLLLLVATAVFCRADQITLTNGDRLSGVIEKSDNKSLVIKSEFAGEVTVQWTAIKEMESTKPLHLETKDGRKMEGSVHTEGANLVVASAGEATTIPLSAVVLTRNQAEEAGYEKTVHPGLLQGWKGGATLGFAVATGNSETENVALAFNAARKTMNDGITVYATSVFTHSPLSTPETTAEEEQWGARYDRNFAPRLFGFGTADFDKNLLQTLDLRSVAGGGIGVHAIKNANTTLDILGGITYTNEDYVALQRSFPAALAGEELTHKLGKTTALTEKIYFFPDLSSYGDYRTTGNFGTVTRISKWLGWQNSVGDIYVTNPPVGKKKNDLLVTTGLNISFSSQ